MPKETYFEVVNYSPTLSFPSFSIKVDAGDRAVQAEQTDSCSASETVHNDHVSGKVAKESLLV